jgi:hypothetical protein
MLGRGAAGLHRFDVKCTDAAAERFAGIVAESLDAQMQCVQVTTDLSAAIEAISSLAHSLAVCVLSVHSSRNLP